MTKTSEPKFLKWVSTTEEPLGIIYKDDDRFIHDFHHPTGGAALPDGFNTFVGVNAGNFTMGSGAATTTQGSYSVGIGCQSLSSLTTGFVNVGVGYRALANSTTGYSNVAIGESAMVNSTTATYNTAVGYRAMYAGGGNSNIGVGCQALYNNSGSNNTAVGYVALFSNTSGIDNVGIGYQAGRFLANGSTGKTTGNYGIYLGSDTKASADGLTNEIAIGYNAIGQGNNTATIGNTSLAGIYFGATAETTVGMVPVATDVVGTPIILHAGNTIAGTAVDDVNGGNFTTKAGNSTGKGFADILTYSPTPTATAKTLNTAVVREKVYTRYMVDNDTFDLEDGRSGQGWMIAGDGDEYAWFVFTSAAVVTLITNSANVTTTGATNDKINIFDNGTAVRIEQTFAAAKVVTVRVIYNT